MILKLPQSPNYAQFVHHYTSRGQVVQLRWKTTKTAQPALKATVTCLPGLESILSAELTSLGVKHKVMKHGAKLSQPSLADLFRSNLYLGTASNILLPCGETFAARGLPELRRKIARLPWQQILDKHVRLEARVVTSKSKLYHTSAIEGRVVAGVYEALGFDIPDDRVALDYPSKIPSDAPTVRLNIQVIRDQVEVSLLASTTPLHRRGYRLQTSKAPLREDLAFAMLYSAGWLPAWGAQEMSGRARPFDLLLDPLCGSGTIAIEAAGMAAGLPPGRQRSPPFVGTSFQNNALYSDLLAEAYSNSQATSPRIIVAASDRDAGAVTATTSNAERAGVLNWMSVQVGALSDHSLWTDSGATTPLPLLVVTNPPFGRRVSPTKSGNSDRSLLPLYQVLQQRCSNRSNTGVAILTHNTELLKRAGWKNGKDLFSSTHGGMSVTTTFFNNIHCKELP